MTRKTSSRRKDLQGFWEPTNVQFLYRHRNGRYYVRTYALGKEKWTSLRTDLLSTARNRMKEHLEAAERLRAESGDTTIAVGPMTFADALAQCRRELDISPVRPATKAFREAGFKKLLTTWTGIEALNVRRISPKEVIDWLRTLVTEAQPHVPRNARTASHNSTGASLTTVKCALDSLRMALDTAVESGHLAINPARTRRVTLEFSRTTRLLKRQRAERGRNDIPTRKDFQAIVAAVRNAGVSDCRACADHIEFLAYSGARKNEAANVQWGDVDFSRGQIVLRVTKNGEARTIPMIAEMRELLQRLASEHDPAPRDAPVLKVRDSAGFITSACKRLGIPRFTAHGLRHLFATACLESGVDVRTAAKWLGHKDHGALLLKTYAHVRPEHEEGMAEKVSLKISEKKSCAVGAGA